MIKYIGSKRTLVPDLVRILKAFPEFTSVTDLFSGTSRVGHALKGAGFRVLSNDHNAYAHTLATCYVQADREAVEGDAQKLIREFNAMTGRPGYFTETFCVRSRFFQPHNGERVDAIRDAIEAKGLKPTLKHVALTSLMEAADRVDSTCGLQMAYVKKWAPRSYNDLQLRMPSVLPAVRAGPCEAHQMDANEAARRMRTDIVYIDPPYNQHSYLSNYHIWETLVLWDRPEAYGVACKRIDCKSRKSDYNSKRRHQAVFADLIRAVQAPLLVVSCNNEGYQSRIELEALLSERGEVFIIAKDFKRYVGAQIGIYNPSGAKVGAVSHVRNKEFIYLVATEAAAQMPWMLERLRGLTTSPAETTQALLFGAGAEASQPGGGGGDGARHQGRVPTVRAALAAGGWHAQAELRRSTGLSGYQVRMALEELCGRGHAVANGTRGSKVYRLKDDESVESSEEPPTLALAKPSPGELRASVLQLLDGSAGQRSEEIRRAIDTDARELRGVLNELVASGLVEKSGQRRGTRYSLRQPECTPAAELDPVVVERSGERQLSLID